MKFLYGNEAQIIAAIISILDASPVVEVNEEPKPLPSVEQVFARLPETLKLNERGVGLARYKLITDFLKLVHCYFALVNDDERLEKVAQVLANPSTSKATHQLQLLVQLYNLHPKAKLLVKIFEFARDTRALDQLTKSSKQISEHLPSLSLPERLTVLEIVAEYNPQRFGYMYLQNLEKPVADTEKAFKITGAVIKADPLKSSDLLKLACVSEMKGLKEFIEVFQSGCFEEVSKHRDVVKKLEMDLDECLMLVKLMHFIRQTGANKQVSYAEVAKMLSIDENLVEEYMFNAIRFGFIEARMNQQKGMVDVSNVTVCQLTSSEWKAINDKLSALRKKFESTEEIFRHAKAFEFSSA